MSKEYAPPPTSPSANTALMAPSVSSLRVLVFLLSMWQKEALPILACKGMGVEPVPTTALLILVLRVGALGYNEF